MFTFTFDPSIPLLNKFDLMDHFDFSCNEAIYKVLKWAYADGKATLYVDY